VYVEPENVPEMALAIQSLCPSILTTVR
jgi:hypothetical protein